MKETPRIAFAWKGLPAYGARLMRSAQLAIDEPVAVIGTRPKVPAADVDSILGGPILWIDDDHAISWNQVGMRPPDLFIATSWATPSFNGLMREVKHAGGKVVCMSDNRWKGSLRQRAGAVYFRLRYRKLYDAMWVPGAAGRIFCQKMGMPNARIYEYLYSGWTEKFPAGAPLPDRPRRLLFVGQYIARKGVDLLIDAYSRFSVEHPDWDLQLFGCGEWQSRLELMPQADVQPFKQTDDIAAAMRTARFFVLPARDDHWPLVVHEAASSGCGLVLSSAVGNAVELANPRNAIVFGAGDAEALYMALCQAAKKDDVWLREAGAESRRLAGKFGTEQFASTFRQICADLLSRQPAAAAVS
jgi:glycosyltransferase involved in cell wall biosynthesis